MYDNRTSGNRKSSSVSALLALILVLALAAAAFTIYKRSSDNEPAGVPSGSTAAGDTASPSEDPEAFLAGIPEWQGYAFAYVNGNKPDFEEDEIWTTTQEALAPLDKLGRCGAANSCIGIDGMPTEPRGDISSVIPAGWHSDRYDFVEGEALYNRCHLIAHQLSGDDAVPMNLITGTSYMNRDGMQQFENAVAAYVKNTGDHVMYRVEPVFVGRELIARGVHMEAVSVEDGGGGLSFNVFCYNVQPGIDIDYLSGDNHLSNDTTMLKDWQAGRFTKMADVHGRLPDADQAASESRQSEDNENSVSGKQAVSSTDEDKITEETEKAETIRTYVLNTNTGKFHYPDCQSVYDMSEHNKKTVEASREDLINRGFEPCGSCRP